MAEFRRPGVFVREVPPPPVPPAAALTALGLVGFTRKGPSNRAIRVESFEDFEDTFGGFTPLSLVPLILLKYFNNGGEVAHIVRITPVGSVKAREFFEGDTVPTTIVGVGDGSTTRFTGIIPNAPLVEGSISITSIAAGPTPLTVTDDGDGHLVGDVDTIGVNFIDYETGEFDLTFSLPPDSLQNVNATATRSRWKFEAQSEGVWGNNVRVSIQGTPTNRKQERHGDFTPPFLAQGNGTAGPYTFTIPGTPLVPNTIYITAADLFAFDDGANTLLGNVIAGSTVNYVTGAVSVTFTSAIPPGVPIRAGQHGFEFFDVVVDELQETGEFLVQEVFEAVDMVDPDSPDYLTKIVNDDSTGSTFVRAIVGQGGKLPSLIRTAFIQTIGTGDGSTRRFTGTLANLPVDPFSIKVFVGAPFQEVLDDGVGFFFGPNVDPFGVNQISYEDGTVDVTFKLAPTSGTPVQVIYLQQRTSDTIQLAGGSDGTGVITRSQIAVPSLEADKRGVFAFNAVEDALNVVVPDFAESALVLNDLIDFAESKRDRFIIGTVASGLTPVQAVNFRRNDIRSNSSFAGVYYPWVRTIDPSSNRTRTIPPMGHVAGVYTRVDRTRSEGKAPAGISDGLLLDIVSLERFLEPRDIETVFPVNINTIVLATGIGIYVNGARTLSTDVDFKYINVRRVFIAIRKRAENTLRFALFEPIGPALFSRIKAALTSIALEFFQKGALAGTTPREAFDVVVDELNTPELAAQGIVKARLAIAPAKPAEFIVVELTIKQQEGTVTTTTP